ncbi:unnamed protein product [Hymenolepis diminuta]|uniref:Uncharacterized protein n=1 Tax=Hymenolepis diminuta TaxID=6216 RepID=A0A564YG08_HYMDI|nr:unnamed protein product [Hymenolepis diminuta]
MSFDLYDPIKLLPDVYDKRVEKELKENKEQVAANLESFKRWTTPMPHLHSALGHQALLYKEFIFATLLIHFLRHEGTNSRNEYSSGLKTRRKEGVLRKVARFKILTVINETSKAFEKVPGLPETAPKI